MQQLKLETGPPNLREWDAMVQKIKHPKHEVSIALVGKYAGLKECYKSLAEALVHGGIDHETHVNVTWIESEDVERQGTGESCARADGILIPGGFGSRGIEGKIVTIQYAGTSDPIPRSVSGHAMRHDRICAQCRRIHRREQPRSVRCAVAASGHSSHVRPAIRQRQRRHDAPGRLRLYLGEGTLAQKCTASAKCANGIATGMNSIMPIEQLTAKD